MKSLTNIVVVVILAVSAAPVSIQGAKVAKCEVRVFDISARPVADAEIAAFELAYDFASGREYTKPLCRSRTDELGRAILQLAATKMNRVYVVARKKGMAVGWDNLPYYEQPAYLLKIVLDRPCRLSGKVVDERYKPIPNARLQAVPKTSYLYRLRQSPVLGPKEWFTTTTDSDGGFVFDIFAPDVYVDFQIKAPQRSSVHKFTTYYLSACGFEAGQTNIRLTLSKEVSVHGKVVDAATGAGIAGIGLAMRPESIRENKNIYENNKIVSAADGSFIFKGVPATKHYLKVFAPKGKPGKWFDKMIRIDTGAGQDIDDVIVEMGKGGLVEIVVRDAATKKGVAGSSVTVKQSPEGEGGTWFSRHELTDSAGKAVIRAREGTCNIRVWCSGFAENQTFEPIEVRGEKTVCVEIELDHDPSVSGLVVDESGQPVAGANVKVVPGKGPTLTDSRGRFRAEYELREKERFLLVRDVEKNRACLVEIKDYANPIKAVLKPALKVSGRVVDEEANAIAAARVSLCIDPSYSLCGVGEELITDGQGRWEIQAIPAAPESFGYRISTDRMGYGPRHYKRVKLIANSGNEVEVEDIVLQPANESVAGRVIDAQGHPVGGIPISQNGNDQPRRITTTDDFGEFTLTRICKGPLRLQAGRGSGSTGPGFLKAEGGDKNVIIIMGEDK